VPDVRDIFVTIPRFTDGIRLVATPTAISCAGLFVVSTLTRWGARSILLDAMFVTEELVTSAVEDTGVTDEHVRWTEVTRVNFITVHLLGREDSIRIKVWDSSPNLPLLPDDAGSPVKRGCYACLPEGASRVVRGNRCSTSPIPSTTWENRPSSSASARGSNAGRCLTTCTSAMQLSSRTAS
jgi:hypothetical protein